MKSVFTAAGVVAAILAANVVLAHGPGTHGMPAEKPVAANGNASTTQATSAAMFAGEIRAIDKAAGKVTLQHDVLKNLKIPKATNVFPVSNRAMLEKVKTGDKVLFSAIKIGDVVTVTAVEAAK